MASFMAAFQAARFHGQFHIYLVEMSDVHHIRMVHGLLLRALPLTDWRLFRILTWFRNLMCFRTPIRFHGGFMAVSWSVSSSGGAR